MKKPILLKIRVLIKHQFITILPQSIDRDAEKKSPNSHGVFPISSLSRFHSSQDMRPKAQLSGLMIDDQNSIEYGGSTWSEVLA
jgi:hypothetical protein